MIRLPQKNHDLRRYVLKKELRRILLYLVWLGVFLAAALSYNHNHQTYPPERRMEGWRMLVWMLIAAVIGFFLFRIHQFFTRRACRGTVLLSKLSHTYTATEDPIRGSRDGGYDFRLHTALILQKPNGKKKRLRFEQKIGSYQYYREGAELIRFRSLPYPINLGSDAESGFVCVACGRMHKHYQAHCDQCGLSLIDPREICKNNEKTPT